MWADARGRGAVAGVGACEGACEGVLRRARGRAPMLARRADARPAKRLVLPLGSPGENDSDGEQGDYAKSQQRLGGKAAGQREARGGGGFVEHV